MCLRDVCSGPWTGYRPGVDLRYDIPMQDLLHVVKKLRNNLKYLTTKFLLFTDPKKITRENCYEFSARWDIIFFMWENCLKFKECVTKSGVALADKQDPSEVVTLSFTYPLFYKMGFKGMGLYLEVIYLTFASFYDKSLTPLKRLVHISAAKAVFTLWRERSTKRGIRGKHFITKESYDDFICAADGLVLYIITLVTRYPDAPIVPWFFTSDGCEQLFGWLRTGFNAGRRSNLSNSTSVRGMSKKNRSLELDEEGLHLLEHTVAHTRGKPLIPCPEETKIFHGRDINIHQVRAAMTEGGLLGQEKFKSNSDYSENVYVIGVDDDEEDDESEDEDQDGDFIDLDLGPSDEVSGAVHLDTAVALYCNGGKSFQDRLGSEDSGL